MFSREFLPQPPPPLSSWRILADSEKELCNITSCRWNIHVDEEGREETPGEAYGATQMKRRARRDAEGNWWPEIFVFLSSARRRDGRARPIIWRPLWTGEEKRQTRTSKTNSSAPITPRRRHDTPPVDISTTLLTGDPNGSEYKRTTRRNPTNEKKINK